MKKKVVGMETKTKTTKTGNFFCLLAFYCFCFFFFGAASASLAAGRVLAAVLALIGMGVSEARRAGSVISLAALSTFVSNGP